jgi:hypothetical protein
MTQDGTEWQTGAMAYLDRLGATEYMAQRAAHEKRRASPKRFCFAPSQYMLDLIEFTKRNDEEGFKARKILEGYASDLGV